MRDLVLLAFVVASLPVCLMRPWYGVLLWTWFGIMAPQYLMWGMARDLPFAAAIAAATIVGWIMSRDRRPIVWSGEVVIAYVLLVYYLFTTAFFAWAPDDAWWYMEKVAKMMLMLGITMSVIYGRERIRWLLVVTVLSVGFYGFKGGIFTLLTGGEHTVLAETGRHVLAGNTALGLALVATVPVMIALAQEEASKWWRRGLYSTAVLSTVSIPFTYSRGALVGLAVIFPLMFPRLRKFLLAVPLLIPLAYFGMDYVPEKLYKRAETIESYEEDSSAMQRIRAWTVAWNVARDYPLTGAGFDFEGAKDPSGWWSRAGDHGVLDLGSVRHTAHSMWFQVLGQHGFLAFFLYVLMLLLSFAHLQRIRRNAKTIPQAAWIGNYARGISVGLIGYLVCGTFLNLAYFDILYIYLFSAALLHRELVEIEKNLVQPVRKRFGPEAAGSATALRPTLAAPSTVCPPISAATEARRPTLN